MANYLIGNLVDKVDNLIITGTQQVGAGIYHPSLHNQSGDFITNLNFRPASEAALADEFIDNTHPIIKNRLEYLDFLNRNNLLDAPEASIVSAGKFASHAEIRVLDEAIKKLEDLEGIPRGSFPESRLDEFTIFVKFRTGTCPPRCVACWHISNGVLMIGND